VLIAQVPEVMKDPDDMADYPPYGAPKVAGDPHDDDGQIFDDNLKANPDLNGKIEPNAPGEEIPPKPTAPTQLRCGTATLLEAGQPQRLLNYDPNRCDLSLWVTPLETAASEVTQTNVGALNTGPAAFTILAEIPAASLPDGWYDITAIVQMTGTTAAADVNNVRIAVESTVLTLIPINPETTGASVTLTGIRTRINGTQRLRISNPGAATGTAIYQATLIANRIVDTSSVLTNSPVYLASDSASLIGASVSALINVPNSPGVLRLDEHTGEVWANLPDGSPIPSALISWIATTK